MEWYAIINKENGRIKQSNMCKSQKEAQGSCNDSERAVRTGERFSANTHYINIDTDEPEERPDTPCTVSKLTVESDGSDTVTFSDMLDGTHIEVSGPINAEMTVSGDNAEQDFTATTPGVYRFFVTAPWPAKPKEEFRIHAI